MEMREREGSELFGPSLLLFRWYCDDCEEPMRVDGETKDKLKKGLKIFCSDCGGGKDIPAPHTGLAYRQRCKLA